MADQLISIRTAGMEFGAAIRGDRPKSVFLHGFSGDLHTWESLWDALGPEFSALGYDLRGFGATRVFENGPYDHAEDLQAVLDVAGIHHCDLVGVSLGGSVALNFALSHPERVRSLILISPGMLGWEWSEAWRVLWRSIVAQARAGQMDQARQLWWEHPLFESTRNSAAGPALHDSIMRFSGTPWILDEHKPILPDVDRLYRLETPTLLMSGGRDLEDFRLIARLIQASAIHLQRVDRKDLGHLMHLEDPIACAQTIGAFLKALDAYPER